MNEDYRSEVARRYPRLVPPATPGPDIKRPYTARALREIWPRAANGKRVSMAEFAGLIGVSRGALKLFMSGQRKPTTSDPLLWIQHAYELETLALWIKHSTHETPRLTVVR